MSVNDTFKELISMTQSQSKCSAKDAHLKHWQLMRLIVSKTEKITIEIMNNPRRTDKDMQWLKALKFLECGVTTQWYKNDIRKRKRWCYIMAACDYANAWFQIAAKVVD